MDQGNWGKKEIQQILDDLELKGEISTAREIKRKIRDEEPELSKMERQLINLTFMCFGVCVSMIARRMTARLLENAFAQ